MNNLLCNIAAIAIMGKRGASMKYKIRRPTQERKQHFTMFC